MVTLLKWLEDSCCRNHEGNFENLTSKNSNYDILIVTQIYVENQASHAFLIEGYLNFELRLVESLY